MFSYLILPIIFSPLMWRAGLVLNGLLVQFIIQEGTFWWFIESMILCWITNYLNNSNLSRKRVSVVSVHAQLTKHKKQSNSVWFANLHREVIVRPSTWTKTKPHLTAFCRRPFASVWSEKGWDIFFLILFKCSILIYKLL